MPKASTVNEQANVCMARIKSGARSFTEGNGHEKTGDMIF